MSDSFANNIPQLYEEVASLFDGERDKSLFERPYFEAVLERLGPARRVLDLGCGSGEPIAKFFIDAGCDMTGVDVAPAMLAMCRARFPNATWIQSDMRELSLDKEFDVIIAWDSFFHLTPEDQRAMFAVFAHHAAPGALLLFTSGTDEGFLIGSIFGKPLYHGSLSVDEYRNLLGQHGFDVLIHRVEDPDCGGHTVWLAKKVR